MVLLHELLKKSKPNKINDERFRLSHRHAIHPLPLAHHSRPAATMIERGIGHAVCRWARAPDAGFVKTGGRVVLTIGVPINVLGPST